MCPNSNDNLDVPVQYNISVLNHWKNTQDTNTKFSPLFVATSENYAEHLHQINLASCVSSRI